MKKQNLKIEIMREWNRELSSIYSEKEIERVGERERAFKIDRERALESGREGESKRETEREREREAESDLSYRESKNWYMNVTRNHEPIRSVF